ncbi:MAG: lysophospholipid acyltransferase family protein [Pseudomonadota bacterium]
MRQLAIERTRFVSRAAALVLLTVVLFAALLAVSRLAPPRAQLIKRWWCFCSCAILGIEFEKQGVPADECPVVFVSNHVSYIDIIILGSLLNGTFVAKSEIVGWPIFGLLGRLVGTFFVKRYWRCARQQLNDITARLAFSESFILFGEGTSSNGLQVLPLKSSLIGAA